MRQNQRQAAARRGGGDAGRTASVARKTILAAVAAALSCCVSTDAYILLPQSSSLSRRASSTRRTFVATSSSTNIIATKQAAKDSEEDLELTRQIILDHILNMGNVNGGPGHTGVADMSTSSKSSTSTAPTSVVPEDATDYMDDVPENDLMIRAALGKPVPRTPIWLFRQAGRHLPEYQEYKQQTNRNFLQLLADPMSVAECTLQPCRRYHVDAAILFSDILVIPEAMGIEVTMPGGVGIQVPNPLKSVEEIETRLPPLQVLSQPQFVHDKLQHVLQAVRQIRAQMISERISIPLIGFSAAPYTLMYYMIGGSSKKNTGIGKQWLNEHPDESRALLQKLTNVVIEYLSAQIDNGCHMIQIFEAMGMMIDTPNFEKFALPCLEQIGTELKARHPDVPLMIFCRGACHMNPQVAALGVFDVITMDGSVDRETARSAIGNGKDVTLQGNYDPAELIVENGKSIETVQRTARELLAQLKQPQRLIANLGEGLGGKESTELVDAFVNAIHDISEEMIRAEQQQA